MPFATRRSDPDTVRIFGRPTPIMGYQMQTLTNAIYREFPTSIAFVGSQERDGDHRYRERSLPHEKATSGTEQPPHGYW